MSLLLLAVGLTLLGCPQALHWGPQDPNFNETLVSGEWFLAGMASNQPKLLKEDKDAGLLVHRIQVTPRALQLHLHKKVNGACVPITMMANKTKRKFQYRLEDADQNRLFLEKVDPKSYVILCNHREKREKEVVVVNLLTCLGPWTLLNTSSERAPPPLHQLEAVQVSPPATRDGVLPLAF
uniref:Uterocalin-like n=1 Tax=Tursiops truncatus TaxID=9739 RepID=A0A6J3RLK0_TURTR|nr:uterocalin-like [Tursiops truncatus]